MLIVALLPLRFGGATLRENPFVTRAVSDITLIVFPCMSFARQHE